MVSETTSDTERIRMAKFVRQDKGRVLVVCEEEGEELNMEVRITSEWM
jgi:hypothetical protein